MAQVIWTEPAISDLDAIADYIALDNPLAARQLVGRVMAHVSQLEAQPLSGPKLPDLRALRYRQIVESPCRVIYRHEKGRVYILYLVRGERLLSRALVTSRGQGAVRRR